MTCVIQSTGQFQCKPYQSVMALSGDLQAARALTVLAIVVGGVGLILAFIGGKCTRFLEEERNSLKRKVAVAAGAVLICTGILLLIPTSVATGAVVRNFYSASLDAQRREIGACLYIGWGASILLILGGGLFISTVFPLKAHEEDKIPTVRYQVVRSPNGSTHAGSRGQIQPMVSRTTNYERTSTKLYMGPPGGDASKKGSSLESEASWVPSTKSQLKRPELAKSEHSEAPSTKSQLKQAMEESLSAKSEESSINPTKTYL